MKKKLNTETIFNELRGESPFFPSKQPRPAHQAEPSPVLQPDAQTEQQTKGDPSDDTVIPRHHDTVVSSTHDTVIPLSGDEMLEAVRKAVKQVGKEPATQRLTLEEKQALDDIEYTYKRQGIKTSGNEIIRIATNYIVRDYHTHGDQSILAKVLNRLHL